MNVSIVKSIQDLPALDKSSLSLRNNEEELLDDKRQGLRLNLMDANNQADWLGLDFRETKGISSDY